eukprot:g4883.t1
MSSAIGIAERILLSRGKSTNENGFDDAKLISKTITNENLKIEKWSIESERSTIGVVPFLQVQKERCGDNEKKPVILLPGTGGSKDDLLPHLLHFAKLNYLAVSLDSRYHGERGGDASDKYTTALLKAYTNLKDAEHPFMYDSVLDIVRVIDFLVLQSNVDANHIGVTGISLGGMHAWRAAAVDKRITAVAPMIGVQSYQWALNNNKWHARVDSLALFFERIKKLEGKKDIDRALVEKVWKRLCPQLVDGSCALDAPQLLGSISPRALLILNGENDPRCPKEGVELTFEKAKKAWVGVGEDIQPILHFEENIGHQITQNMWEMVEEFFDFHLKGAKNNFPNK